GLASSTIFVRRTLPTTWPWGASLTNTPFVRPYSVARSLNAPAVTITPPCRAKLCRCSRPCQPNPGRTSSVSAQVPKFGVRAVCFQGIGLRHIGRPSMIELTLVCDGGSRITSYLALRSGSFAISWVLMYVNGTSAKSNVWRHQPSSCVSSHVCTRAILAARAGCVFTLGADVVAYAVSPSALIASVTPGPLLITNEPRLNALPFRRNVSSAIEISAVLSL